MKNFIQTIRATTAGLLILLPGLLWSQQPPADSLTVLEAVRTVVASHPAIVQASENVGAADERVKLAQSAWYPTVGVEAVYARLAPIATIQFGPEELRLYPADNYDAHIGVRQQIYDFGKTGAATDLSRSRSAMARLGVDVAQLTVAYQTVQAFYAILYLREAVDVQDQQIATLREHIEATKKRVASGSATDFDVLTTEVRMASAQNQRIDLQNGERKAEIALARLLNRAGDAPLPLKGSFERGSAPSNLDSLLTVAYRQRPELLSAASDVQAAQLQVRVADLSENPSLNLGVSYGVKNGYMPNLDVLRGNLAASIQLAVPIFEGGRGGHREQEAEALLRAAEARLADAQRQVAQEVRQAMSDLRSAEGKLSATELQVAQAREAVSIARKRYDTGAISNLDLLDTETSLEQADLLRLQALYGFTTSRYALERAVGTAIWK